MSPGYAAAFALSALFFSCTTAVGSSVSYEDLVTEYAAAGTTGQEEESSGTNAVNIGQDPGTTDIAVGAFSYLTGYNGNVTLGQLGSEAEATGYANFGSIHAQARTGLSLTFPYDPYNTLGTHSGVINYYIDANVNASAYFQASFNDTLNWTGHPVGTPVTVKLGIGLEAGISAPTSSDLLNYAELGSSLGTLIDTPGSGLDNQWQYFIVTGVVGTPYNISESLTAQSNTELCDQPYQCSALTDSASLIQDESFVDAFDTGSFSVEVLTPGVSYTSDSGTVYATTLPEESVVASEPSSMAILALAASAVILMLGGHRRLLHPRSRDFQSARLGVKS